MKCPCCFETISGKALKCKHCGEWVKESKKCPYCAEAIEGEAANCRFCGATQPRKKKPVKPGQEAFDISDDFRNIADAARRFANAMPDSLNHMSIVTQCIAFCDDCFGGIQPSTRDVNEFVDSVAQVKQWSHASAKSRKSEIRTIVTQYRRLPSACKAVVADKRCKRFNWHDAVHVARLCRAHTNNKDLVSAFYDKNS